MLRTCTLIVHRFAINNSSKHSLVALHLLLFIYFKLFAIFYTF